MADKRDSLKPVEGAIQHLLVDLVAMTVAELEPLERTKIETLITVQVRFGAPLGAPGGDAILPLFPRSVSLRKYRESRRSAMLR